MVKLISRKRKNSPFPKKKRLVRLAPVHVFWMCPKSNEILFAKLIWQSETSKEKERK